MAAGTKRHSTLSVKRLICTTGARNSMRFAHLYLANLLATYGLRTLTSGGGNPYYTSPILTNRTKKVKGKSGQKGMCI